MRAIVLLAGLLSSSSCERSRVPEEGHIVHGSLDVEEMRAFFAEKSGVSLPTRLEASTGIYNYCKVDGATIGYTDMILKMVPEEAKGILDSGRMSLEKRAAESDGLFYEYRNFIVGNYGGLSIPEDAPVLYWDDGNSTGERVYLEIDPGNGVLRFSYSVGVERDGLARHAHEREKATNPS